MKDGGNWYAYCGNDPVNYIDPSGYIYTDWDKTHGVDKNVIDKATEAYKNAKTQKERDAAHQLAENERNKYRNIYERGTGTGYTITLTALEYQIEINSKLNLVKGYFETQKDPASAQRGAWDAVNQLSLIVPAEGAAIGIGKIVLNKAVREAVERLVKRFGFKGAGKVIDDLPTGGKITGYTKHGTEQALGRDGGIGVSNKAITDAVNNPVKPPIPQSGGTTKYIGKDATVVLNQDGKVVTTWANSSAGTR